MQSLVGWLLLLLLLMCLLLQVCLLLLGCLLLTLLLGTVKRRDCWEPHCTAGGWRERSCCSGESGR